jgi:23S rRNA (cytidine1920-2'-O)/16S rRNA (cytidine1409-2'-O)-methyltransferase
MAGDVTVDGRVVDKPGAKVEEDAAIAVKAVPKYVSRGGLKLEKALDEFGIDVAGMVVVDVGSSTGGFTDCVLQRGARRVYAVDVGYGQLDWRLRSDPRVVVMERTNVRYLGSLPEPADLAVMDLSFISLRLVIPAVARLLRPGGRMVALVKPQFEAGREQVGKGGVVRDPGVHRSVLLGLVEWGDREGFGVRMVTVSPIKGPAGNVEFLVLIVPGERSSPDIPQQIEAAIAASPKS